MTNVRHPVPPSRQIGGELLVAELLCLAGSLWLAWLQLADAGRPASAALVLSLGLTINVFALPLAVVAVPVTLWLGRSKDSPAVMVALACAPVAAASIAVGEQLHGALANRPTTGLPVFNLVDDFLTLLVVVLPATFVVLAVRGAHGRPPRPTSRRVAVVLAAALATVVGTSLVPTAAVGAPSPTATSCLGGGAVTKTFDITARDVDIPINRFGDHDPNGKMYVLTSMLAAVDAEEASQQVSVGLRDDPIQALVIRANEGDCVEITYTNDATGGDFGLHIDGLEFTVSSSGDSVGANASSAVPTGGTATYRFAIPDDKRMEGGHYIHPGPGYRSAVSHGLFGGLMVEPPGSTYWNASHPGQPLESGWEAIIKPAGVDVPCDKMSKDPSCGFREAALLHHEIGNDNELLKDKNGLDTVLVDKTTGSYRPGGFALNYRSEPFRNRLLAFPREKSHAYSSYTFGEPATPIMRGYLADPTKIRIMHVGTEKFHVFHLHGGGDRWRFNPVADPTYNYADTGLAKDPTTTLSPSQRLDSQSIGPGESYDLEIEGGAGGVQQSVGDFLFHCHIAKHYVSGMWGVWRVYDTRQPDLVPIGDRPAPPTAVDSRGLIGKNINGTTLTKANLDSWIRQQLPPSGIPRNDQDATVWNWKVAGTQAAPLYLGAPADPTVFPDSLQAVPGQPNLLPVDAGHVVENRPTILFNPLNGRPAYPLLRTQIGKRPPFTGAGHTGSPYLGDTADKAKAGSTDPWAKRTDGLCPSGRNVRKYNVVAIGKEIRRTPSFVDPEGKIFVLAHDKKAAYAAAGGYADPLAIRANQGDCVAITLTNEIPDASAFDGVSKTSMHIHHVQFDVQGSDGVSVGFAYEHSVKPYQNLDPTLTAPARRGDIVLHLSSVSSFQGTDANGKPTRPWLAVGEGLESIDIRQVASVDARNNTVTLTAGLTSAHSTGEFAGTEFIQYRWYPDVVLDNIFWHDHVDGIHGWGHGLVGQLIVEPYGSTYHDPVTGEQVDSGTLVDIHTNRPLSPGLVTGSFRELALWTINDNDRADYSTLNLKAEPLATRLDKANQFSSWTYGDPVTPMPRLYPNDPLVVRSISVSPTVDTLAHAGRENSARTPVHPHLPDRRGGSGRQHHRHRPRVDQREVHADLQRRRRRHADAPRGLPLRQRQRAADPAGRVGSGADPARQGRRPQAAAGRLDAHRALPAAHPDRRPGTGRGLAGQPVPARRADPAVRPHRDGPVRHVQRCPHGVRPDLGRRGDQGAHQGDGAAGPPCGRGRVRHGQPDERAGRARRVRGGQGGPSGRLRRRERRVLLRPERRTRRHPALRLLRAQRPRRHCHDRRPGQQHDAEERPLRRHGRGTEVGARRPANRFLGPGDRRST